MEICSSVELKSVFNDAYFIIVDTAFIGKKYQW